MNLDQIKYILEVAKEKSLTRAANNLHVSTPAISKSISQLEKELGISIFHRSRQGTIPTSQGKKIIKSGLEILSIMDDLHKQLTTENTWKTLRVGCGPSLTYVIYDAYLLFIEEHRHIQVEIIEMDQDDLLRALKYKEIDIGFTQFDEEELKNANIQDSIFYDLLYTGHACVYVSKHSHLYHKDHIYMEDIRDEKVVLYNSKRARLLNEKFLKNVQPFLTSNNVEVLRDSVLHGHAICILYDFSFKNHLDVRNGNLAVIPLGNPSLINFDFWTFSHKNVSMSVEAKNFQHKVIKMLRG
ncbi:LysR family transcriptional regulator [Sutcliffiella horikoshii]|uniref:LysR family transcriptional regulator n=1 Tax=Sutcliffiella horikoshii TaxID=79883 RepID=A0A5D4T527_9BACI|nr:LysR family transcriptional regulator [Sutcliffiella horikoshii]TYS69778.1 LysR family transcriptional regulator [Sutcliffiella horikoshii]